MPRKSNIIVALAATKIVRLNNENIDSSIDKECREMWYLVWIVEFHESSSIWTQVAPQAIRPRARLPRCHASLSHPNPRTNMGAY